LLKSNSVIFVEGHVFDTDYQGSRTFLQELYKSFSLLNPEVTIYISSKKADCINKIFLKNNNVHHLQYKFNNRLLQIFIEVPFLLMKIKADYAHFQYFVPFIKIAKCKYFVTIHDVLFNDYPEYFPWKYSFLRNIVFRMSAIISDYVTTVSNYSKESIMKHYKIKENKIFVIPNAVSESYFLNYSKEQSMKLIKEKYHISNFILYVSRIEPRKNQQLLLESYFELELYKSGINLVFIGSKTISNYNFEALYNSLDVSIKKNIHIISNINESDLLLFYQATKLFVYPSLAEGFGIPPLEAASVCVPVIISNQTAMLDFDFFSKNFINPYDKETLKDKIINNINSINSKDLIKIKDEVSKRYSWKASAELLKCLLNEN